MRRRDLPQCVCFVTAIAMAWVMPSPASRSNPSAASARPVRSSFTSAPAPTRFLAPLDDSSPIQPQAVCAEGDAGLVEKALPAGLAPWAGVVGFAAAPTPSIEFATNLVFSTPAHAIIPLRC